MISKLILSSLSLILLFPPFLSAGPANTVVATINTGVTPGGIGITPDGRYAYIANNNNYGLQNINPSGATVNSDSVTVIDLSNNSVLTTIYDPSFMQPYTVTINPAGTRAYITNSTGSTISIINIATNAVIGTISGFDGPSGMAITSDGNTGYVNNYGGPILGSGNGRTVNVVSNLNTTPAISATINVGLAPAALAITADDSKVYVIDYSYGIPDDGSVSIITTSNNTVELNAVTGLFGPFNITLSPDGKYAFVTNFGSNNFSPFGTTVSKIDLSTNTIVDTFSLGIQPAGSAITPDSRYALTSNYNTLYMNATYFTGLTAGQGTVNIIDIANNAVLPITIDVGQSPNEIAITPNGAFAYVTNYTSNTVSVIALQTFQISAQGCRTRNVYLRGTDYINSITLSATGYALPVSYSVYRDEDLIDLIGTIPASQSTTFYDHNTNPNLTYTYYVIGTNAYGTTSAPIAVTVNQSC
jgi:YVTN family beta-propeller protein